MTDKNMQDATETVEGLGHVEDDNQGEQAPYEPKHAADDDTFDRKYVEELRQENARYRTRAKTADAFAERLHTALVAADGRLQDATDLPFDAEHLDNAEALSEAITALIEAKPHLKARRATGDIGAGNRGESADDTDLIGIIRRLSS